MFLERNWCWYRADPIGIEIGITSAAEKGFTAVLVAAVTKNNCICGYVFEYVFIVLDIFTQLCSVASQTIVGLFGDLFGGLLFNVIRLISGSYLDMNQWNQMMHQSIKMVLFINFVLHVVVKQ